MDRLDNAVEAAETLQTGSTAASSATGTKRFVRQERETASDDALGFGTLPDPLRMAMSLIARQAAGPDEALEPVIGLLVENEPVKRDAIVLAFRTNTPLREQWLRTYEILRR